MPDNRRPITRRPGPGEEWGGIRKEGNAASIGALQLRHAENIRLVGSEILGRGGQSKVNTSAVTGCPVGIWAPEFSLAVLGGSGLGSTLPGWATLNGLVYLGFSAIAATDGSANFDLWLRAFQPSPVAGTKFYYADSSFSADDPLAGRVTIGLYNASASQSSQAYPVEILPVAKITDTVDFGNGLQELIVSGGVLLGRYYNGGGTTENGIYRLTGATMTYDDPDDATGGGLMVYGSDVYRTAGSGGATLRQRTGPDVWVDVASFPAGWVTGTGAEFSGNLYIPALNQTTHVLAMFRWDGAALTNVNTISTGGVGQDPTIGALVVFNSLLYYSWYQTAAPAGSHLGTFNGAAWTNNHKDFTGIANQDIAQTRGVLFSYNSNLCGRDFSSNYLVQSPGTSTSGTWTTAALVVPWSNGTPVIL